MTYLAPRQGLFAIIILISFFIHTVFLVISTNQQIDELKLQTGNRMLTQLVEEVKLSLLSKDKVSLSVLTRRYTSENNVSSLVIKDVDGTVQLQTGQAQLLNGNTLRRKVVMGDNIIGEAELTLRDTSNGEIIASQWIFILGSFIVHLLIWLLYGYIARPTRSQLAALSRDVQDHLMQQHRGTLQRTRRDERHNDDVVAQKAYAAESEESSHAEARTHSHTDTHAQSMPQDSASGLQRKVGVAGLNIKQAVKQYVQSHQDDANQDNQDTNGVQSSITNTDQVTASSQQSPVDEALQKESLTQGHGHNRETPLNLAGGEQGLEGNTRKRKALVASRPMQRATVQIHFYDPYHLINTLAPEQARPYFALCTQLLQRTLTELLKQPLLHGVEISSCPMFDDKGAMVTISGRDGHSKTALAGVMLARAYMMLHDITSMKFRELKCYSADVYIGVSDDAVVEQLQQVLLNNAQAKETYTLLPLDGIKQLKGHMQLHSLPNPTSVYERDAAIIEGCSDAMMQRLVDVRNAVLLSAELSEN